MPEELLWARALLLRGAPQRSAGSLQTAGALVHGKNGALLVAAHLKDTYPLQSGRTLMNINEVN